MKTQKKTAHDYLQINTKNVRPVTFRIPVDLHDRLKKKASGLNTKIQDVVKAALEYYFDNLSR